MAAPNLSILQASDRYLAGNYARYPVAFVRGEGRRLFDDTGKSYLDMLAGLGVSCLGYGHPRLLAAIREQSALLVHASNLFYSEPAARLAEQLVASSFAERVFFCNSGTEANEAAIKMARRRDASRKEIVAAFRSFHGRTLGALAATGQPDLQEGFGPMPGGFVHVEYGDADALAGAVGPATAAVILEPIIGEGGILVPADGYLEAARKICDQAGALLIFDEVQCGWGRTGFLWAHQEQGVTPDILTAAKGLAGGLPIGALLATEDAAATFVPGAHGSTFGANPVCAHAAHAVFDVLHAEGVLENCRRSGERLRFGLEKLVATRGDVLETRGRGLMRGLLLAKPARPVVTKALERGLVVNATAGTVVRFLPPLTITCDEVDEGLALLAAALDA
jgi:predicted acetylornithine/succinylornithine family transaminase